MRLFSILFFCSVSVNASASTNSIFPVLTKISLDCKILGSKWEKFYGVVINDLSDLSSLSSNELEAVKKIRKQIQPLGIISMAEYTCVHDFPLNSVTIKVFIFKNEELALNWWKKKYEDKGWEEYYTKTKNVSYLSVDSKQLKKRSLLRKNIWITTHHIKQGNEHLILLKNIVSKLLKF